MKALRGFFRGERGMVPYSLLGITMLLIVGVAIYHFNNVDILRAQERNTQTFDMETFYATARIGQDLQQVARASAENTVLGHSMSTYDRPVDVNTEWDTEASFENWKNTLAADIAEDTKKEIYEFYRGGNQSALEKRYYNPLTEFDFSNFISHEGDIEVNVTKDSYDNSAKVQRPLELKVGFKDRGVVSSKNRFTGYEMSMPAGTVVSADSRPFTMADKAYNFTQMFNKNESVDEMAWHIWGMQTVLGLLEANVKHNVKFATDDRATYSLMQLIIAYKELEHFGTFDYVHTTLEFLRPWMGSEGEAAEFLSLFQEGVEAGYVDQAIESMDAAIFVRNVADEVQSISDSMIVASSYLDSDTVTADGGGFNMSEVAGLPLSGNGTVQHLKRAEDTQLLKDVYDNIMKNKMTVFIAKDNVESSSIIFLSVADQLEPLKTDYSEVRDEWKKAKSDFSRSQSEINSARDGYYSLSSYIESEVCINPLAAMLWFGDSNQNVKGFREILPAKVNETDELVAYYGTLEKRIDALEYDFVADSYNIDEHYKSAKSSLNNAEASMRKARAARERYLDQKYKHDNCYRHVDWKDPAMGGCLGSGYACEPYDCNPYDCGDCVTETDEDGSNGVTTCDTCWNTCYRTCYDCVCDKNILRSNYYDADAEYTGHMTSAEGYLASAATEVSALQRQIDAFLSYWGLGEVYTMIESAHGMYDEPTRKPLELAARPYSISDNYYSHWNYSSCADDKKYKCAKMLVPDPSLPINSTNYASSMPKSPLTYDDTHREYSDYGLYYIKYVIDKMDETFNDESIDVEAMKGGKIALERMKNGGFFETMLAILKPVNELMDTAGDVKSAIATIKNADKAFPNVNEHFYTTLPLPPFNGSKLGFENQGFTVIHDIRLRADTRPGEIELPIIGPITLGKDNAVNPALPIPYTPISVYLWEFEIGPSKVGTGKDGTPESSTLWLIDMESTQIAPLMEMQVGGDNVPVPLYLHKPVMYKYEFTPQKNIRKGLDRLPPVFILSLGPFMTRFRSHMEPPDKEITNDSLAIDVAFDREFTNDRAVLNVDTPEGNFYFEVYISEVVNGNSVLLSKDLREITAKDLTLLSEYGWSEVRADAYVVEGTKSDFDIQNIKGDDHARVYFIDHSLTSIGIRLEKTGSVLKVVNTGDKRVDVAMTQVPSNECSFIFYKEDMAKNWIGSINYSDSVNLTIISEGNTKITARVSMPEKVEKELEGRSISLTLEGEIWI